jgi:BirA family biotin operon repressor/biotin-[acetyl-CoA-carboxylase] ligase
MPHTHRPLTVDDLRPPDPHARVGRYVHLHDTIDSTNAYLLARAAELPDGSVAWAEHQTAGRGRLGRTWQAPRGASILMSILLHEPHDAPLLTHGTLLGTLAACEAVEQTTLCTPGIRWPNDIVVGTRKLGGVLAESCTTPGGRALVLGIGLNCLQHEGHFRDELASQATSLEIESPEPIRRAAVAAAVLARLNDWLQRAADNAETWETLRETWQARCEDVGTRVTLLHNGHLYAGTAIDIAPDGDIIVELDQGGRRRFAAATTTRNP